MVKKNSVKARKTSAVWESKERSNQNKNRDFKSSEIIVYLDFTKYLNFPEVQKNSKVVNV